MTLKLLLETERKYLFKLKMAIQKQEEIQENNKKEITRLALKLKEFPESRKIKQLQTEDKKLSQLIGKLYKQLLDKI